MHVLSIDGPGQGISRLRGLLARPDNFERAASEVITYLLGRPEVDPDRLGVIGGSMGSYWATRLAASDVRVKAVATISACYGSKTPIFEQASPRFKWAFQFMAGLEDDEAAFDRMMEELTVEGLGPSIRCPALMVVGEYDQLSFLDDSLALFDELGGPREFWLLEDESHSMASMPGLVWLDGRALMVDWLRDVFQRGLPADHVKLVRMPRNGKGPYEPPATYPLGDEFAF
jgi:pimeloyl-ACP methyl ester carboxylesterase